MNQCDGCNLRLPVDENGNHYWPYEKGWARLHMGCTRLKYDMKVIFLDVDGVLITRETCRQGFGIPDPECVKNLNWLVQETKAMIVVSSCWRIGRTIQELREMLQEWGVEGKVLDKTPLDWEWTRGMEIRQWLETHPTTEAYVILDDDTDMDELISKLVQTTFEEGLTKERVERARRVLEL